MKTTKIFAAFIIAAFSFTACDNNDADPADQDLAKPTIDKIELGLGNNEIGVIGEDFHFNAEVVAGDKIEKVQIKIVQRTTETYSKVWSHEINWPQYAGAKNATIHKHFDIPAEAVEGKYDFLIIITDQNGTKLEIKKNLTLYTAANLPVKPVVSVLTVFKNDDYFYRKGNYSEIGSFFKTADKFSSQVTISGVKGTFFRFLSLQI